jgi:6-phosphogluconolactonase
MKNFHISKDISKLSISFAEWIISYADDVFKEKRYFYNSFVWRKHEKLHEILVSEEYKNRIDWEKWHFLWETKGLCLSDERSNAKMAYETLLNYVPVQTSQIHFFDTEKKSAENLLMITKNSKKMV